MSYTAYTSRIIRHSDGAIIPLDPENTDYATYLQWLAAGNTPDAEPVVSPGVPQIVTMRQARLALLGAGLLPMVDAAIAALPSPQKDAAKIEWEYSQEVQRNKPFVQALGASLGLTSDQLDDLFLLASTL